MHIYTLLANNTANRAQRERGRERGSHTSYLWLSKRASQSNVLSLSLSLSSGCLSIQKCKAFLLYNNLRYSTSLYDYHCPLSLRAQRSLFSSFFPSLSHVFVFQLYFSGPSLEYVKRIKRERTRGRERGEGKREKERKKSESKREKM